MASLELATTAASSEVTRSAARRSLMSRRLAVESGRPWMTMRLIASSAGELRSVAAHDHQFEPPAQRRARAVGGGIEAEQAAFPGALRLRDDDVDQGAAEHISLTISEGALGCRIELQDVPGFVEADDAVERRRKDRRLPHLALAQQFLRDFALDQVPELVADRAQRLQQLGIGQRDLRAEKLQHVPHIAADLDRHAKCRAHPRLDRNRGIREIGLIREIRDPLRFAVPPHIAGQPFPKRIRRQGIGLLEFFHIHLRRMPDLHTVQDEIRGVHIPDRAEVPLENFADALQDVGPRVGHGGRIAEGVRGRVLQAPALLAPPMRGDVFDRPLEVAQRPVFRADRSHILAQPNLAPIRAMHLELEIGNHILLAQRLEQRLALCGIDVELGGNILEAFHQMLGRLVTVEAREGLVGGDEAALRRGLEHALDGVIKDRAILGFRLPQLVHRLAPLRRLGAHPPRQPPKHEERYPDHRKQQQQHGRLDAIHSRLCRIAGGSRGHLPLHPQRRRDETGERREQRGTFPVAGWREHGSGRFGHEWGLVSADAGAHLNEGDFVHSNFRPFVVGQFSRRPAHRSYASPMPSAADLRSFEIPGQARFIDHPGGLTALGIATPAATGRIFLHGAHITAWQPADAGPVLFTSAQSHFTAGKAIRGGVPLIFPWFGARAGEAKAPQHGFARSTVWAVESVQAAADQGVTVVLRLDDSEQTRASWPHAFTARLRATFGATLAMALEIENRSPVPLQFEEALHTYLAVSDVEDVAVRGLENTEFIDKVDAFTRKRLGPEPLFLRGETDRVFVNTAATCTADDDALRRRIVVEKTGSASTVVWNPWEAKARAMADFGDDEWPRMLCLETANAGENSVTLAPGATHTMTATIRVEPLG